MPKYAETSIIPGRFPSVSVFTMRSSTSGGMSAVTMAPATAAIVPMLKTAFFSAEERIIRTVLTFLCTFLSSLLQLIELGVLRTAGHQFRVCRGAHGTVLHPQHTIKFRKYI